MIARPISTSDTIWFFLDPKRESRPIVYPDNAAVDMFTLQSFAESAQ